MSNKPLPDGWKIAGYWTGLGSDDGGKYREAKAMSDRQVSSADRIVVVYNDEEYRTINGAEDWDGLIDLIEYMESHYEQA